MLLTPGEEEVDDAVITVDMVMLLKVVLQPKTKDSWLHLVACKQVYQMLYRQLVFHIYEVVQDCLLQVQEGLKQEAHNAAVVVLGMDKDKNLQQQAQCKQRFQVEKGEDVVDEVTACEDVNVEIACDEAEVVEGDEDFVCEEVDEETVLPYDALLVHYVLYLCQPNFALHTDGEDQVYVDEIKGVAIVMDFGIHMMF